MNQKSSKKNPLVLLPKGPYGWSSHQYIVPELVSVWRSIGYDILPIWYPEHRWQYEELEKVANASVLVFPLGYSHYRGLQTLSALRTGYGIQTPACMMYTSDINTGMRYLALAESVLRPSDCLVVNCSSEARLLKAFFPKSKLRVREIPLPVNESIFTYPKNSKKNQLRKSLNLPKNEKILLYAGRISSQKNIVSLLSVFRQIRELQQNVKLIVLGDADEVGVPHFPKRSPRRYIVSVSEAVNSLGIESAVEFRPAVSQTDLAGYFQACDVHVSLSVHSGEDFGYSIAQGLACGIPTIVTKWGGGVDLSNVSSGVSVSTSVAGPMIDHPAALKQLSKALDRGHQRNSAFLRRFGKKAIAESWLQIENHYGARKTTASSAKSSILGTYRLPKTKYFTDGEDKNFKKFALAYANQKSKSKLQFHLQPLFFFRLLEQPDIWKKELRRMKPQDRVALQNFVSVQKMSSYFDKIPGLSKSGSQLLLELGVLCPGVKEI